MQVRTALALMMLAVAAAACRVPEVRGNVAVQFADYVDVPVPVEMVRDREHSLRLETPVIGSVVNVYRGGALAPEGLTEHFVQQMPTLGWRLVSRFEHQGTILVFVKDGTLCFLGIGPVRGNTTLSVLVGKGGQAVGAAGAETK